MPERAALKWRSVLDNVLFLADALGLPRKNYVQRSCEILSLVGLQGFEKNWPSELSGGMAQRVALCRALLLDPGLMLMDEPFGALDAFTREEMNLELLRIWEQQRKTILFVTHSIAEAVFIADRVLVIAPRPGRVILDCQSRSLGLAPAPCGRSLYSVHWSLSSSRQWD